MITVDLDGPEGSPHWLSIVRCPRCGIPRWQTGLAHVCKPPPSK